MDLKSMYFFDKDPSSRKLLVIRIEGQKNQVSGSLVGIIVDGEIPDNFSEPFKTMRAEFVYSGVSRHLSVGEAVFNIDNHFSWMVKNNDNLSYVVISSGKILSPRKISLPAEWLR